MIDIHLKISDEEKSPISAFAYSTGKVIEGLIRDEIGSIKDENALLTSKILHYRMNLPEELRPQYDLFFGITKQTSGKINN